MYATMTKVRAHATTCGPGPRLDELIASALKGQAMDAWESSLADTPVDCLGTAQAFSEPEISAEQVEAVRARLPDAALNALVG